MNTAFLLAAGLGTRLRPLTEQLPKALVPICGIPMLDLALAQVHAHGHRRVMVNAHWLWEAVAAWADRSGVELQVELPEILGTGGGLRAARPRLAERFVVVNADVLSNVDLGALLDAVPEGGAAMALRESPEAERIGPVEANSRDEVVRIRGVVEGEGGVAGTHFTGVHAMHRDSLDLVPPDGLQCIVRTAYKALIPQGRVRATHHAGTWVDVGNPTAWLEANLAVLDGKIALSIDPWTRGGRGPGGSWVGPGARLEGEIHRSVIGAEAVVPAGAELHDCVVLDGVAVPAGLHRRTAFYGDGASLSIPD